MYYVFVRLIYAIYGPVYMVQIQINKKFFKVFLLLQAGWYAFLTV